MARRHKEWAQRARVRLIEKLGGKCSECQTEADLDFDCKEAKGDRHHRMDASARMCFYHKQHKEGNLQLLCRHKCHKKKTVADLKRQQEQEDNEPF